MNFENKVIIITGASSGIGSATAKHFAKYNVSLSLVGRNLENLKKTEKLCKDLNNKCKILIIQADVTKDCQKIIDETINNYGKLDILINNAGIADFDGILETTTEKFDKIWQTDVRAVFELTKLAVPHLIKTKGNIVNVSSLAGLRAFPIFLSYCMSKAALDQFTRCISLELAPKGVRVNSVNPAIVETDIFKKDMGMDEKTYENFIEESKTKHPIGRNGNVDDVASAILFLANEQSSFLTGVLLPIDGGRGNFCPV